MIYVLETYASNAGYMLWEMTKAEFKTEMLKRDVRRVSGQFAHDWVKRDRIHSTSLWVEDGKIRRA